MFPFGDASRTLRRFPVVTVVIIAVNVVVFVLELAGGDAFIEKWSMVPANITAGRDYVTILTAMFMHASWSHIIGNMIYFWAFGPEIEDAMGRWRYLAFYLIGGTVAMLAQIAADPHSTVPNLGASGAIAAVMGGFLVTYPRDRIRTLIFLGFFIAIPYINAALLIGLWFLIQLFSAGDVSANASAGGVAYLAHVGGFVFGVLFARLFELGAAAEGPT